MVLHMLILVVSVTDTDLAAPLISAQTVLLIVTANVMVGGYLTNAASVMEIAVLVHALMTSIVKEHVVAVLRMTHVMYVVDMVLLVQRTIAAMVLLIVPENAMGHTPSTHVGFVMVILRAMLTVMPTVKEHVVVLLHWTIVVFVVVIAHYANCVTIHWHVMQMALYPVSIQMMVTAAVASALAQWIVLVFVVVVTRMTYVVSAMVIHLAALAVLTPQAAITNQI
jgi:hypothetical protein